MMLRRRTAYLLITCFLSMVAVFGTAPAALAHAVLESTSPAEGAILATAPTSVSATFDEQVGISPDSLRVFAPNGQRVDTDGTTHGKLPQQITVNLIPGLSRGTYTVGWHVISADSHPVQGAFTFSVGAPSASAVTPASLQPPASKLVTVTFGVVRGIAFGSFALMIGVIAFVICCWPGGARRKGVIRLAMTGWGALTTATLAAILLQGVYGAGQSIGHLFFPDVLHATLYSRYGRALGIRLLLEVAALITFSITLGALPGAARRGRVAAATGWGLITAGLAATWAVADHAGTGMQVPLSIPSDMLHLSAIAIWTGGLATLTLVALRPASDAGNASAASAGRGRTAARRSERRRYQVATADAASAVSRFSPIALGCVTAIVATGTYQAWRGVGTWDALFGTVYGRLLLVKIGAMCGLIFLGNLGRLRVRRLRAPIAALLADDAAPGTVPAAVLVAERDASELVAVKAGTRGRRNGNGAHSRSNGAQSRSNGALGRPDGTYGQGNGAGEPDAGAQFQADQARGTLSKLRRSVTAEAVIAAGVLSVAAILVNTPTARESYNPPASATATFDTGGPGGKGTAVVVITPDKLGPNEIRLSLTGTSGQAYQAQQVQASLSLPGRGLGPLPVQLTRQQNGVYLSAPAIAEFTGQWQLLVTVRSDAFDETTIAIPVPIR